MTMAQYPAMRQTPLRKLSGKTTNVVQSYTPDGAMQRLACTEAGLEGARLR